MSEQVTAAKQYRLPLVLFVVGVVLAASSLVWRDHARRPRYVVTVEKLAADPHQVLASDCPVNVVCVATGLSQAFVVAVNTSFPGVPTNDLAHAALTAPTGRWAARMDLRTAAGVQVRVASRCIDDGAAARADQSPSVPTTGPATVFVVVPGRPGCSVAVVLQVPTGVSVPWAAATTLAHRSELQLTP